MKLIHACRPDGSLYGLVHRLPVGYVHCAARPSPDHVFTGVVSMDASVMWRAKTPAELDTEKDTKATEGLNQLVALRATVDVLYALLPDPKPAKAAVMASIKTRYKELM